MFPLILLATSLAASPVEDAQVQLQEASPPSVIVSCQPVGDVIDYVRQVPIFAKVTAKDRADAKASGSMVAQYIWSLFDEGGLQAAGFKPEGAARMAIWGDIAGDIDLPEKDSKGNSAVEIVLPFAGDETQFSTLMGHMGHDSAVLPPGESWEHSLPVGDDTVALKRSSQGLVMQRGATPQQAQESQLRLLEGLPKASGCLAYAYTKDGVGPKKARGGADDFAITGGVLFLPLGDSDAHMRLLSTMKTPAMLSAGAKVEKLGRSRIRPMAAGVVSMDLLVLARELLGRLPDDFPGAAELRRIDLSPDRIPVQVPPGTQFAMFMTKSDEGKGPAKPGFALVIPVHTKKGRKVPGKKLMKALNGLVEELKIPAEPHADGGLVLKLGKRQPRLHAAKGVLVLSTIDSVIEDMIADRGEPWVSDDLLDRAETYPVATEVQMPQGGMLASVGLKVDDGLIDLAFGMKQDGESGTGSYVVGMLAGIAIPNFVEMQFRAKRAEAPSNVDGIKTALIAYDAAFDTYIAAPAHPRPVAELDREQAEWPSGSPFDTLGWGPDGKVRGTYSIEVSPDGTDFKVTGAIDVDGDGVPAIFTATKSINTTMQTPSKVY